MTWLEIKEIVDGWTRDSENDQPTGPCIDAVLAMASFVEIIRNSASERDAEPSDPSYITWETGGGIELGAPEGADITAMQFTPEGRMRAVKR